jgi:hypothetical protein
MRFITKKASLIFTITFGVVLAAWWQVDISDLCTSDGTRDIACSRLLTAMTGHSFYFFILLAPALLLALLPSSVFNHWRTFALPAIPIITILTIYIMQMSDGGGVGVVGIHPGLLYLPLIYGAYFLISFAIIGWSWWKTRKS